MSEQHEINFRGHRVVWFVDHASAAALLRDAGLTCPKIPAGCNTVLMPFACHDGRRGLAINQTGFAPVAADDEREVNGCMALVLEQTLGAAHLDDAVLEAALRHVEERP